MYVCECVCVNLCVSARTSICVCMYACMFYRCVLQYLYIHCFVLFLLMLGRSALRCTPLQFPFHLGSDGSAVDDAACRRDAHPSHGPRPLLTTPTMNHTPAPHVGALFDAEMVNMRISTVSDLTQCVWASVADLTSR